MTNIKRNMKRLTAALLSLLMALVLLAPSAFADDVEAKITVDGTSVQQDLTSMTVKAYQVLDQVNDTETDSAKKQYQVNTNFDAFFAIDDATTLFDGTGDNIYLTYAGGKINYSTATATGAIQLTDKKLDETYPEADLVNRLTGGAAGVGSAATFYTWVEKYIESKGEALQPTITGTFGQNSVVLDSLDKGYYALTFSDVPDGVSVKQGILIATPGNIALKAEKIPLTKEVKNPSASHNGEDYSSNTTANMGDTLDYKITSKVPTLTDTENLTTFKLSDVMQKQMLTTGDTMTLTVGSATFEATVPTIAGGTESATANFEDASSNVIAVLTVKPYNDTGKTQEFTVDFLADDADDNWTRYQGDEITLTYSAKLTADAYNINLNTITLTIDNNDDETTQTASTEVYTYGIEVEKTFSDGSKSYNGVTFNLYAAGENGAQTTTVIELAGSNGVYHKKTDDEEAANTGDKNLLLDTNCKLTITGLDEGIYWLEETGAPAGFTVAEPIKIVLVQDDTNKENLDKEDSTAMYNGSGEDLLTTTTNQAITNISLGQFKVYNQKGFTLPQTGGAGTWMFTVGGIVLIAVAGGLFIASRKKSSSK